MRATLIARLARLLAAGAVVTASPASAQQFHLYLNCTGKIVCGARSMPVHLDLALRDNNMSVLVQRSNVLPVGERMKYVATPTYYTMVMDMGQKPKAFYDMWRGTWVTWEPTLRRLNEVRLSVDRQNATLEGEMIDASGDALALLKMNCTPRTNEDAPAPKFCVRPLHRPGRAA